MQIDSDAPAPYCSALLHLWFEQVPPLQSESVPQYPHSPPDLLVSQSPILQSALLAQCPHLPCEQIPLPLQSEFVPHDSQPYASLPERPPVSSTSANAIVLSRN